MKFRAHDTFFIRKGWLSKGLKHITKDPFVFMGNNGNPMDILGIGANMVKALRYWLLAVQLTAEPPVGAKRQELTPFGELVNRYDHYIEEIATLWLLHYKLCSNVEYATAWYYFFNEFRLTEFTKDDFVVGIKNYLLLNGHEVSERSLEDDFNCIINTYVPRQKSNPGKVHPESNIDCPFGELGLVDIVSKRGRLYKKSAPKKDTLPPLILLAVILDNANGKKQVRISDIQNGKNNACKLFNLDSIGLFGILGKLELMGYVKIIRTSGLDIIEITTKMTFLDCVQRHYESLQ